MHNGLRGGDIDLLVECAQRVARLDWLAAQITARLQRVLGDRTIDVLVIDPATWVAPVHRVDRAEGIVLQPFPCLMQRVNVWPFCLRRLG